MLPNNQLMKKITEAYDHALNNRVNEFRSIDKEITSLVPHYVQQISYSTDAVVKLNKVQLSNLITQSVKIIFTIIVIFSMIVGLTFVPIEVIPSVLASGIFALSLLYLWKKIPIIRMLWESTREVDIHSTRLYSSLSECIKALSEIKGFHEATIPTIQEWQRQGMWTEQELTDEEKKDASETLEAFLDSLKDRDHYDDKD